MCSLRAFFLLVLLVPNPPTPHRAKAEEEHEALVRRTADEARYRHCLSRTRAESVAALANFLPALRKRLFLAVDVTGPVSALHYACYTWYD